MFLTSLKTADEILSPVFKILPERINLENYLKILQKGNWTRYFINSIFLTITVTGLSLLINSMAGFSFARIEFIGRKTLFILLMLGLMIPAQITLIPMFIIIKNFPLAGGNNLLGFGGSGLIDTYLGIMLPQLSGAFGIFLCRQFYLSFPKAIDDAAFIDGCAYPRIYFNIYLPQSKSVLISLGTLKLTYTWNDYMWPLVVVKSDRMRTVQLALASFRDEVIKWEMLMAATTLVSIPLIIVFLFNQSLFTQGISTAGLKG